MCCLSIVHQGDEDCTCCCRSVTFRHAATQGKSPGCSTASRLFQPKRLHTPHLALRIGKESRSNFRCPL
ncbi:hypothetical protein V5799_010235 [Amblyomma americanum]|uniref:Uncharacterized protein n=1 Tax=Amblyomma americanum TaxID=6943 RepID=A0AAQ4F895_AMBAM